MDLTQQLFGYKLPIGGFYITGEVPNLSWAEDSS